MKKQKKMATNCTGKVCSTDIPIGEIHHIWWIFDRWCTRKYGNNYHSRLTGMDCVSAIRKFASRNKEVKIQKVDDNDHGDKSIWVLIPHPTMGVTIITVPEKSDQQNIYFLYPNRINQLIKKLMHLQNKI